MIKNVLKLLLIIFFIGGCATVPKNAAIVDKSQDKSLLPVYSGLKSRITIADFELKAAKASSDIGFGLREMLVNLLINSNKFSIIERQNLVGNGNKDKVETADLIVSASVVEFEPQASGGSAGVGGGGGVNSGLLGGLLGASLSKAHMTLEIKIADAVTSEIVATTSISGRATDMNGDIMGGVITNWKLGSGLDVFANSPMEKAIRICIIESMRYVTQNIPLKYYKY